MTDRITLDINRVTDLRIGRGLTRSALAERAGISGVTRTRALRGDHVSMRTVLAIAKALEVAAAEIIGSYERIEGPGLA